MLTWCKRTPPSPLGSFYLQRYSAWAVLSQYSQGWFYWPLWTIAEAALSRETFIKTSVQLCMQHVLVLQYYLLRQRIDYVYLKWGCILDHILSGGQCYEYSCLNHINVVVNARNTNEIWGCIFKHIWEDNCLNHINVVVNVMNKVAWIILMLWLVLGIQLKYGAEFSNIFGKTIA